MAIFLQFFLSTILLSHVFASPTSTTEPTTTSRPEKELVLDTIGIKKTEDPTPKVSRPEIHIPQPNENKRSDAQGELLLFRVAGKCDVFKTENGEEVQLVNADLRKPKISYPVEHFSYGDDEDWRNVNRNYRSNWEPSNLEPWRYRRIADVSRSDMSMSRKDLEPWEVYWLEIYNKWLYAQMPSSGSGSGSNENNSNNKERDHRGEKAYADRSWDDHHYHEHVPADKKPESDQKKKSD